MKTIKPSFEILTSINRKEILENLEAIGRTCYKSEDKITEDSSVKFIQKLVLSGHEAMIEFFDITVKFIHNRGFTHEIVRHRLCNFSQESTRYVDYSKDKYNNEITLIEPYWFEDLTVEKESLKSLWMEQMEKSENTYLNLRESGLAPQAARGVLPIDIKTEINVKANLREWRQILKLRCSSGAHPDMRRVMIPLKAEFIKYLPEVFGDLVEK